MANCSLVLIALLFLALKTSPSLAGPNRFLSSCEPSTPLIPKSNGKCDTSNGAECCKAGNSYPRYECSPPVTGNTEANLSSNNFEKGGDGGGKSECDDTYHSNNDPVVALSTGWFNKRSRCGKNIKISAKGKSVFAKVVDECDSYNGCDSEHGYQPPCGNNFVDASEAVWKALGLNNKTGVERVTWSDA